MPARGFDGTDDRIMMALGDQGTTPFLGTVACLCRLTTSASNRVAVRLGTGTGAVGLEPGAAGEMGCVWRGTFTNMNPTTGSALTGDGRRFIMAASKDTGSVVPRLHFYDFTTRVWLHRPGAAAIADPAAPGAGYGIGGVSASPTLVWPGTIAAAAFWHGVILTDDQIESLAHSYSAWWAADPSALWLLDQDPLTQKVLDQSGGGANESSIIGTTLSGASMVMPYTHGVMAG